MIKHYYEAGYYSALFGLSLSYYREGSPLEIISEGEKVEKLGKLAKTLAFKQGGHNKFLETITVFMTIRASRGFWQEFDTYRVGMTKQSSSTMHTLAKTEITYAHFLPYTDKNVMDAYIELSKKTKDVNILKASMPEGFLQTRNVCTNYKTLQNMIFQREKHRLKEWRNLIKELKHEVSHPELLFLEQ